MTGQPVALVSTQLIVGLYEKDTGRTGQGLAVARWLYNLARSGKITNHGGVGRGQALWDWWEVEDFYQGVLANGAELSYPTNHWAVACPEKPPRSL